jgi:hypothetical protein
MLFDVLNFISKMLDYQPENKNRKSRKQNMGEVISPSYPTVTVECRTAIKALFLYFNM